MGKNSEVEIQINSVLKLLLTSGRISKSEFLTSYTPYYPSTFSLLSHSTHPTLSTLLVSNTTFSPYFFSFQPTFTPSLTLLSSHFHSILFTFTQRSLPTLSHPLYQSFIPSQQTLSPILSHFHSLMLLSHLSPYSLNPYSCITF